MSTSRLQQAYERNDLRMVQMDSVRYFNYGSSSKRCFGTMNLNSCTAIAIVSSTAAILAHIAPRPTDPETIGSSGDENVREKLSEIRNILWVHGGYFQDPNVYAVMVYGVYNGQVALPDQVRTINSNLQSWNLPTVPVAYRILEPNAPRSPAKGTVLIDTRGQAPVVYVEDKLALDQTL
jgi:hypothetical protein